MGTCRQQNERCETCRFWDAETTECHRRAPVMVTALGRSPSLNRSVTSGSGDVSTGAVDRSWPQTRPDEWCGEWDGLAVKSSVEESVLPIGQTIATQTFLGKIAPSLETPDSAKLLEALLNQLPPDVRRVVVRVNGLDGQPLIGLKEIAREFRMSREQVRTLVAAGEKRLAEVVGQLAARRHVKRDA